MLREVQPDRSARLIELGCGPGTVATHLNAAGYHVDYGDIHAEGLRVAAERAEQRLGEKVRDRRFLRIDVTRQVPDDVYRGIFLLRRHRASAGRRRGARQPAAQAARGGRGQLPLHHGTGVPVSLEPLGRHREAQAALHRELARRARGAHGLPSRAFDVLLPAALLRGARRQGPAQRAQRRARSASAG